MRLWYSKPSPFTRKVLVVAHEAGAAARIQLLPVDTVAGDDLLNAENPLGKIPCLVTDDGMMRLFDSRVICEYLDTVLNASRLHPAVSSARWLALRRQALADGVMDAAVLCRYESMRPETLRSAAWVDKQQDKIRRGLDTLEQEHSGGPVTIGDIATACALGYLDLRFPELNWRAGRPHVPHWFEAFARRPSMLATAP